MNSIPFKKSTISQWKVKSINFNYWISFIFLLSLLTILFYSDISALYPNELKIYVSNQAIVKSTSVKRPDQLPQSHVAKGNRNIIAAWLAGPTTRYHHGVLGDELEASKLIVESFNGKLIQIELPITRVFEDLEPRLSDINKDNKDEIIVVESDSKLGASLSLYGILNNRLIRIAATPFLGKPKRWLNPLGVGDFYGDGNLDIALVAIPHIGGILRLYKVNGSNLSLFAEYSGVCTHKIGTTELSLGSVVFGKPRDRLLVPNQTRQVIMLLEWTHNGLKEITRIELPGYLSSSLKPLKNSRWLFRLEDGKYYEIQLD